MTQPSSLDPGSGLGSLVALHRLPRQVCSVGSIGDFGAKSREKGPSPLNVIQRLSGSVGELCSVTGSSWVSS